MKMKMVLAAAIIAVSASGAWAQAAKEITFLSFLSGFPQPTGCGLAITFSDAKVPGFPDDPENLAAAKPTGNCAGQGVAIGAIGMATVAGETGNFLSLGQNVKRESKQALLYVIQLDSKRRLFDGGAWGLFRTTTGRNVEPLDGGIYQRVQ